MFQLMYICTPDVEQAAVLVFVCVIAFCACACRWPEDLPPNSCIVLSGNDDLCHAEQVQKMVAAAGTAKVRRMVLCLLITP
jgi:hypothetical protein